MGRSTYIHKEALNSDSICHSDDGYLAMCSYSLGIEGSFTWKSSVQDSQYTCHRSYNYMRVSKSTCDSGDGVTEVF